LWPVVTDERPTTDRRAAPGDRRRQSRSGRRASDPHTDWRRLTWLFAVYGAYLSLRALPAAIKRFFQRPPAAA
jgi:hypothetical protein